MRWTEEVRLRHMYRVKYPSIIVWCWRLENPDEVRSATRRAGGRGKGNGGNEGWQQKHG